MVDLSIFIIERRDTAENEHQGRKNTGAKRLEGKWQGEAVAQRRSQKKPLSNAMQNMTLHFCG